MPKVIDIHQHMWDYGWLPEPHKMNMAISAAMRRIPYRNPADIRPRVGAGFMDPSGATNIKVNDRLGVDVSVIQVVDWSIGYGVDAETPIDDINRLTGEAVKNSGGRLEFFCGIDPRRPGAAESFRKYVREYGAKGYKLYPPMGYYPWEDFCEPIYKVAIEENVPILAHTQAGLKWAEPIHWNDVCKKFPDLEVILGHAGTEGPFFSAYGWEQAMVVASKNRNTYLDPTEWHLWGGLDNIAETVRRFYLMKTRVGAHRVVFGTDNPLGRDGGDNGDGEWTFLLKNLATIGRWYNYPFTQSEVDMMMGGNAERLLGYAPKLRL